MSSDGYQEFRFVYNDSSYDFRIFPQQSFTENLVVDKNISRAVDGRVHSFKFKESINYQYSFGLSFVNSSDTFRINDLWQNQIEFVLQMRNDNVNFNNFGRIVNQTQPISQRVNNNFNLFTGNIQFITSINTVDILTLSLSPFILDDPVFGVLDGNLGVI